LKRADSIKLLGTGRESRDFIQINDLCRLINCILKRGEFQFDIFNAASGKETFISDIAVIFETFYKGNKRISFSNEIRIGDPVNWHADITKANAIGFNPSIALDKGIEDYINWYESLK
jgi:nucleoside-diphosphate-sugar epimerase